MPQSSASKAPTQTFRFAPDVVVQVIDGDALLLRLHDEEVFSLNETGARIAQLIGDGNDVRTIIETLGREYGVDRNHIDSDVTTLIRTLVAKGLIVAASAGAAR